MGEWSSHVIAAWLECFPKKPSWCRCHELSLYLNRVCTDQSLASERASAEWQSAVVTPQFNLSFSFVSRVSKHLIECIAIKS